MEGLVIKFGQKVHSIASLKESISETRKNVFYFTSKGLSFSRKSDFRILDIKFHDVIKCLSINEEIHLTE